MSRLKAKIKLNLPDLDVSLDPSTPVFLPSTPCSARTAVPWYAERAVPCDEVRPENFETSSQTLYQEFLALAHVGRERSRSDAMALANVKKNRYENIHPYNDSRVVLKRTASNDMGYINASIVGCRKEYIAAQGPLPHTQMDFWRMMVETQAEALVMLTRVDDESRHKSCAYWEPQVLASFREAHGITVTLSSEQTFPSHTERTFLLTSDDAPPRTLTQYHFTEWPDHDVPDLTAILDFHKRIRQCHAGMLVVHCSAGVGRTGSFCAIDMLLSKLVNGEPINIPETVATLRKYRMHMCQTLEQYTFIYDLVKEAISHLPR